MYLYAVLISAIAILRCCEAAESNQQVQQSTAGGLSPGVKQAVPLTPNPQTETRQYFGNYNNFPFGQGSRPSQNRRCPLCDSSVYPYCGERLLHDACCCTDPYINELPYQCKLADCRFLHANSCREHRLIANCCCNDDYRSLLKTFLIV